MAGCSQIGLVATTVLPAVVGYVRLSRTAFYALFVAFMLLALAGAIAIIVHMARTARARSARSQHARRPASVDMRWDDMLLPARLTTGDGEQIAPEVAAALAELDRYATEPGTVLSPFVAASALPVSGEAPLPSPVPADAQSPVEAVTETVEPPATVAAVESWAEAQLELDADMTPGHIYREVMRRQVAEDEAQKLMDEGIRLAQLGRRSAAHDIFATVTRLRPNHVEAWLWRGGTAGSAHEAVRCLQQALELDPQNERARKGLTWALSRLSAEESGAVGEEDPLPEDNHHG